jgi:hypothetical protein
MMPLKSYLGRVGRADARRLATTVLSRSRPGLLLRSPVPFEVEWESRAGR